MHPLFFLVLLSPCGDGSPAGPPNPPGGGNRSGEPRAAAPFDEGVALYPCLYDGGGMGHREPATGRPGTLEWGGRLPEDPFDAPVGYEPGKVDASRASWIRPDPAWAVPAPWFDDLEIGMFQEEPEPSPGVLEEIGDYAWLGVKTVALDGAYLATAPLRINSDTAVPALVGLGIVGTAVALDEPVQRWTQKHRTRSWDRFWDRFEQPGNSLALEAALVGIGGVAWGTGATDSWILEMGLTAFEARIYGVLIVNMVKISAGRRRPNNSKDAFRFGFNNGHRSLPSQHVVNVAPTMFVMSRYIDQWWFDVLAWTVIGLKAGQRVEGNHHWVSDTVGSIGISWLVANALVDRHENPNLRILPWAGDDLNEEQSLGLQVELRW